MSRLQALMLALLVTVSGFTWASSHQVMSVTLLPQEFYVGDRVEMRLTLRTGVGAELTAPDRLPSVEWGEIHQVRVAPRGLEWDVRIVLTSYQPGTRTIPALDLGPIILSDLSIHVPSILGEGRSELTPPRPQVMPPGTRLWVSLLLLALLLFPVGWIVFLRWGRRYVGEIIERYRERKPYRRLNRSIKALTDDLPTMDGRQFYILLLESIRRYVSTKLGTDCMAATTSEFGTYLDGLITTVEDRRALLDLFHYGDLVKFASGAAPVPQRQEHITTLKAIADRLEKGQRIRPRSRPIPRRQQRVGV